MSFKTILEEAEKHAERAMKSKINDNLEFPGSPGVYLIYTNEKAIYIGQSNNLRNRFKQHLSTNPDPQKSTLRRILKKKCGIKPENTKEWITKNSSISFYEIDDSDMRKLVESLLIAHYRTKDLLNS